ncbi:MAG: hypothetical protein JWR68_1706 [Polaromonas sp.]|nr:hypothetical protein [Polaromonas sp.]
MTENWVGGQVTMLDDEEAVEISGTISSVTPLAEIAAVSLGSGTLVTPVKTSPKAL